MSCSSSFVNLQSTHYLGFLKILNQFTPLTTIRNPYNLKFHRSWFRSSKCNLGRGLVQIKAMDEFSDGFSSVYDCEWADNEVVSGVDSYILSSSGDESETEVLANPTGDVDLPSTNEHYESSDGAIALTAHRFSMLQRRHKIDKILPGNILNMGLIAFLVTLLLLVDWCSWRIARLPLAPFYLTHPFITSAVLALITGDLFIPIFKYLRVHQTIRRKDPHLHSSKKRTPIMGGLFLIPIGVCVARSYGAFSLVEVIRADMAATLAFAAIGLIGDFLGFVNNRNHGLSGWIRISLEVAVGLGFSLWLESANISSPYNMEMLVPLPAQLGLVYLRKDYLYLTSFCFVSMGNGVNLTDGLDGLAGGTTALSFIGMSISVLPISYDFSIFGASMVGACIGFLVHIHYKASILICDTGSLALGGALTAMDACTGMFFPLFYLKTTKHLYGVGRRLFRMTLLHHHFEYLEYKQPIIVAIAYIMSCILALFATYVGLVSA